jgi:hypothetical protein
MPAQIAPLPTLRRTPAAMPNDQPLHQARGADSESAAKHRTPHPESERGEKR